MYAGSADECERGAIPVPTMSRSSPRADGHLVLGTASESWIQTPLSQLPQGGLIAQPDVPQVRHGRPEGRRGVAGCGRLPRDTTLLRVFHVEPHPSPVTPNSDAWCQASLRSQPTPPVPRRTRIVSATRCIGRDPGTLMHPARPGSVPSCSTWNMTTPWLDPPMQAKPPHGSPMMAACR